MRQVRSKPPPGHHARLSDSSCKCGRWREVGIYGFWMNDHCTPKAWATCAWSRMAFGQAGNADIVMENILPSSFAEREHYTPVGSLPSHQWHQTQRCHRLLRPVVPSADRYQVEVKLTDTVEYQLKVSAA